MTNNNPFDDNTTLENVLPTIEGLPNSTSSIVNRLAEIEDELDSRGIDPLIKEKEELRKELKSFMLDTNTEMVFDETSSYEAVITDRSSDVWDTIKLEKTLTPSQMTRYIRRMVDESAVKEGIKNGDLSRPTLEKAGAVKKKVGAKALYVRKRK